jgi:hypothetical protein
MEEIVVGITLQYSPKGTPTAMLVAIRGLGINYWMTKRRV